MQVIFFIGQVEMPDEFEDITARHTRQDFRRKRPGADSALDNRKKAGARAFGNRAIGSNQDSLVASSFSRGLVSKDITQQVDALYVTAMPADIGLRNHSDSRFSQRTV